jgi:small subunit ribosomal protein S8
MLTDPISDMLTRIRNALMAEKAEVIFPFSKIKLAIAEILKREGFLADAVVQDKDIKVILKYKNNESAISSIRRVSKPGRRIYSNAKDIKGAIGGKGINILSTPLGILTNKEAKKMNVGGEVLCEVY